ncbi:MAG TPA: xanthine dehydrogenase family protein molybdopterin-binding subunit, partial [Methylomirabilota bacterium]|nr:xanthine dehydrogenase family protein molybdopterin-binding subunit [Methylomirabilota bacterium]
ALLTGAGRFVDDLPLAGAAHVVLVRSPHAHARVLRVEADGARGVPGVLAVLTAADLDGALPAMPVNRPFPGMAVPPHPLLAGGVAAGQGTPVAAVVAESAAAAADGAAAVRVEYARLAGVADPERALQPGAPAVGEAGNRSFVHAWRAGDPDAAFARAARVVSLRVRQQRLAGVPLEPRGVAALWETATGSLTVWTSTQAPFRIRAELARMLGVPESRVRVVAPDVGGGFGVKGGPYREEVLAAWLARRLGRPVKWVSTRVEDLVSTHHARGGAAEAALALAADGRVLGLRARIVCPLGASLAYTVTTTPRNHGRCLPGPYAVADADIEVTGALTTTPPVGSYRGAGRPEAAFLIERLVDEAARALGMDPAEIRRRNFIAPDRFPFMTATGQVYDSGDYAAVLEQALALADYAGLRRSQAARRARGEVVGVGVAVYVEPSALGWESGLVRVERTGAVTAVTGASPHGQGHETTFAQIVADHLGVEPDAVAVLHGDTRGTPPGMGTAGSRSVALAGSALALAAGDVRDKGRRLAAALLEASPADVRAAPGGFEVAGAPGRGVGWAAVAEAAYGAPPAGETPGLEATRFFSPEREVWSAGAVVAAVAIDGDTGVVTPERLAWVDDAGTIVNPLLADGQLDGSLAQAWGQAVMEAVALDAEGHLLSGTLMDYAVPRAADVPHAVVGHACTPSPLNPLGAKGLGEAG